jgi:hypothetical protein
MKRDMDLVRTLLLKVEETHFAPGGVYLFDWTDDWFKVDGHDHDTIIYNFNLIYEAGFLQTPTDQGATAFIFSGLSWAGHEFLDNIRNPDVWSRTKDGMKAVGGFGLEIAAQVAKAYVKQFIEKQLGLRLE